LHDDHIGRKHGAVRKQFQRTQGSRSPSIQHCRSFVIPAATGAPRAFAIIRGIFCFTNPVNGQLPNTVFDLRQNVIYAHRTLMRA
jgi:hypothetical protein